MPQEKKQRKAKFNDRELEVLVDNVSIHYKVISAKFSDVLTNRHKTDAWKKITESVNAVGTSARTVEEIRRKRDDLKSRTKKKAGDQKRDLNKTGAGEASEDLDLSDIEHKIIDLIGNTVVFGIAGGLDTQLQYPVNTDADSVNDDNDDELQSQSSRPGSPVSTDGRATPDVPTPLVPTKRTRPQVRAEYGNEIIQIEKEKLMIWKRQLDLEEKRLGIEEKRLKLEEEKIALISTLLDQPPSGVPAAHQLTAIL